jgi:hypothetical protein
LADRPELLRPGRWWRAMLVSSRPAWDVHEPSGLVRRVKSSHDLQTRIALLALEEPADLLGTALAGPAGQAHWPPTRNVYRD